MKIIAATKNTYRALPLGLAIFILEINKIPTKAFTIVATTRKCSLEISNETKNKAGNIAAAVVTGNPV